MNHDMGNMGGDGPACKVSMTWNWYTIDACFLSTTWHIKNEGMFAATCIGVILMVITVEVLRRMGKEYDDLIMRQFQRQASRQGVAVVPAGCSGDVKASRQTVTFRATPLQQLIRSIIHAMTFGLGYIVMLMAMYFNGYVIICIFLGAGIGKFLCDWLVVKIDIEAMEAREEAEADQGKETCCG